MVTLVANGRTVGRALAGQRAETMPTLARDVARTRNTQVAVQERCESTNVSISKTCSKL